LSDESGQDLIEYSLLLAFLALSSLGMMLNIGTSAQPVWSTAENVLVSGEGAAGCGNPTPGVKGGRSPCAPH
jgi:Flp pilus assembly pilin Flp